MIVLYLQFVTEGHVLLLALKMAGLDSLEADPGVEDSEIQRWVHRLATQVVDRCWLETPADEVATATDTMRKPQGAAATYSFCICKEGKLHFSLFKIKCNMYI
jgi:hypothetical protein